MTNSGPQTITHATAEAITIERAFDAPRDLVFRAWTEPEHLKRWFAPAGFTTPHCTVDLRVGGMFHYSMRSPDGQETWGRGIYREIVVPERIVYVDSFADAEGNFVPPSQYGVSSSHPTETLVTISFAERAGRTVVTVRHELAATVEERDGALQGWSEMLDRLADVLAAA